MHRYACSPAVRPRYFDKGNPHEMPQDPMKGRDNGTIMTTAKEALPFGHYPSGRTMLPQDVYRYATS